MDKFQVDLEVDNYYSGSDRGVFREGNKGGSLPQSLGHSKNVQKHKILLLTYLWLLHTDNSKKMV